MRVNLGLGSSTKKFTLIDSISTANMIVDTDSSLTNHWKRMNIAYSKYDKVSLLGRATI